MCGPGYARRVAAAPPPPYVDFSSGGATGGIREGHFPQKYFLVPPPQFASNNFICFQISPDLTIAAISIFALFARFFFFFFFFYIFPPKKILPHLFECRCVQAE